MRDSFDDELEGNLKFINKQRLIDKSCNKLVDERGEAQNLRLERKLYLQQRGRSIKGHQGLNFKDSEGKNGFQNTTEKIECDRHHSSDFYQLSRIEERAYQSQFVRDQWNLQIYEPILNIQKAISLQRRGGVTKTELDEKIGDTSTTGLVDEMSINLQLKLERTSAMLMVRFWNRYKLVPVRRQFIQTDAWLIHTDYERMQKTIMDPIVIKASGAITNLISNGKTMIGDGLGRILLTAFTLAQFFDNMMPNPDDDEINLGLAASKLIDCIVTLFQVPCRENQKKSNRSFNIYLDRFKSWQLNTKPFLVENLISDYKYLKTIERSVSGTIAASEWNPHIDQHKAKLKNAIRRVSGHQGLESLNRSLEDLGIVEESSNSVKEENISNYSEKNSEPNSVNDGKSVNLYEHEKIVSSGLKDGEESIVDLIPGKRKDFKIRLAHELMIDDGFDFIKIMQIYRGDDSFTLTLPLTNTEEEGAGIPLSQLTFVNFVVLLRDQLKNMLPDRSADKLGLELDRNIDEPFLTQQAHANCLDMKPIAAYLIDVMGRLCAPMRDNLVEELNKEVSISTGSTVISIAKKMGDLLQLMRADLVNFHMRALKPQIHKIIIPWEREWFVENVLKSDISSIKALVCRHLNNYSGGEKTCIKTMIMDNVLRSIDPFGGERIDIMLEVFERERLTKIRKSLNFLIQFNSLKIILTGLGYPEHKKDFFNRLYILMVESRLPCSFGSKNLCKGKNMSGEHYDDLSDEKLVEKNVEAEVMTKITDMEMAKQCKRVLECIFSQNGAKDTVVSLMHKRMMHLVREAIRTGTVKDSTALQKYGIGEAATGIFVELCNVLIRVHSLHLTVLSPIYNSWMTEASSDEMKNGMK